MATNLYVRAFGLGGADVVNSVIFFSTGDLMRWDDGVPAVLLGQAGFTESPQVLITREADALDIRKRVVDALVDFYGVPKQNIVWLV